MSQDRARSQQEREIAYRILNKCLAEQNVDTINTDRPILRTSIYTGIPIETLKDIQKKVESGAHVLKNLKSIGNKSKSNADSLKVDDFDRHTIHRCLEDFILTLPNLDNINTHLLKVFQEKFAFPWDIEALNKLMIAMGYCTRKSGHLRYGLERDDYVLGRKIYIEEIRKFRESGRNIFYIDETWIDHNRFKKYWRIKAEDNIITDVNAKGRLILIHAGSKNGFLDSVKWLFEVNVTRDDLQVQMGEENFELWVTKLLIPNLPQNSVVVMDSAKYHNELNRIPDETSTKEEMLEWVKTKLKGIITLNDDIDKDRLHGLIKSHSSSKPSYKIDSLLKSEGHYVLRIPPCMNPEFNPMILAWEKIASIIDEETAATENQDRPISVDVMKTIAEKAISKVTVEDWREFYSKAIDMENIYYLRDKKTEEAIVSKLGSNHRLFTEAPSSDSESN